MKALIIAAGRGSRLERATESRPKPLIPVLGLTILERVILSCRDAGVTEFVIVVGYREKLIREALEDGSKWDVSVRYTHNAEWERANGLSVLAAEDELTREKEFLLLMSDHLVEPELIRRVMDASRNEGECLLAVDQNTTELFDPDDVTKVHLENERITAIDKALKDGEYNGADCGVFRADRSLFAALHAAAERGEDSLTAGNRILIERNRMRAVDVTGLAWIDVDHAEGLKEAKRRILRSLIKPQDGFVSRRINRPVSLRITSVLVNTPVTANQVSAFTLLLAAAGCEAFFRGEALLGAVLIHMNSVIDGVDGEMARLRRSSTFFGGWWDRTLDRIKEYLIFVTLGLRASATGWGNTALICAMLLAFFSSLYLARESAVTASGLVIPLKRGGIKERLRRIQMRPENVMILIALGMALDAPFPLMILLMFLYILGWIGWTD